MLSNTGMTLEDKKYCYQHCKSLMNDLPASF